MYEKSTRVIVMVPWGDLERSLAEKEEAAKQKSTQSHIDTYMYVSNSPKSKE